MKEIEIFCDGSSLGNPGPGGYGVILRYGSYEKELSRGYKITTNNRMELLGALAALSALKEPCKVTLYSDSNYVIQGMTAWRFSWRKNYWDNISNGFNLRKGMNSVASVLNNNENKNLYSLSEI